MITYKFSGMSLSDKKILVDEFGVEFMDSPVLVLDDGSEVFAHSRNANLTVSKHFENLTQDEIFSTIKFCVSRVVEELKDNRIFLYSLDFCPINDDLKVVIRYAVKPITDTKSEGARL